MNGTEDSGRDFGDEQDMLVADKPNPTLGPTEASQDMSTLNQIIVPVGAYTDPNNPSAQSASVNLTLDKSPVEHDEDYGKTALDEAGVEADTGSMGMVTDESEGSGSGAAAKRVALPEDPEERVAAANAMKAGEWITRIEATTDRDDLDELRSLYDASDADFTTVDSAFDKQDDALAAAADES